MEKIISICGLVCSDCGAYQATRDNDDNKRREVAELWSKEYKSDIKPEDIHCLSCLTESDNVFGYTRICKIRKCGKEKGVDNCAFCEEYACERLNEFFKMVPDAKTRLDEIRSQAKI
jgi:hypothetical protein